VEINMARYKIIDRNPKFIPVALDAQLMPGSFEYALDYLIDHEIDLTAFDLRYKNDDTGAPAYAPAVLLKIVLLAYSRSMISSRAIERACRENVLFIAISGDSAPQFTTIAKFIRELGTEIASLFTQGFRARCCGQYLHLPGRESALQQWESMPN
jgi:transposase